MNNRSSIALTKEKYVEQNAPAMPMKTIEKIKLLSKPTVCRIITKEGISGTGGMYNLDLFTEEIFLFATVSHVLSEAAARSGATELHFTEVEALKDLTLKKEWIAFFWENKDMDAIVIELTASAVAELKAKNANSLRIKADQINTDSSGQPLELDSSREPLKLVIVQYPNYKNKPTTDLSFAYNYAKFIDGAFLKYRIETSAGSSGSPVLNWEGEALAMHNGEWEEEFKETEFPIPKQYTEDISKLRKGVMWHAILPVFLKARTNFKLGYWYV